MSVDSGKRMSICRLWLSLVWTSWPPLVSMLFWISRSNSCSLAFALFLHCLSSLGPVHSVVIPEMGCQTGWLLGLSYWATTGALEGSISLASEELKFFFFSGWKEESILYYALKQQYVLPRWCITFIQMHWGFECYLKSLPLHQLKCHEMPVVQNS